MLTLSSEAKRFLHEIRQRPEWAEVLEAIQVSPPRCYRPSRSASSSSPSREEQEANWIFESGRSFENDRVINLLKSGDSK